MFFMPTSSLYQTLTIICKFPQSSSEFRTQIQPQRPGRFSNASQKRAPIARLINTSSHYKDTGVLPNGIAGEEGNHSMVTLKRLQSLMAVIGEN
jgi:hypothetical protein